MIRNQPVSITAARCRSFMQVYRSAEARCQAAIAALFMILCDFLLITRLDEPPSELLIQHYSSLRTIASSAVSSRLARGRKSNPINPLQNIKVKCAAML